MPTYSRHPKYNKTRFFGERVFLLAPPLGTSLHRVSRRDVCASGADARRGLRAGCRAALAGTGLEPSRLGFCRRAARLRRGAACPGCRPDSVLHLSGQPAAVPGIPRCQSGETPRDAARVASQPKHARTGPQTQQRRREGGANRRSARARVRTRGSTALSLVPLLWFSAGTTPIVLAGLAGFLWLSVIENRWRQSYRQTRYQQYARAAGLFTECAQNVQPWSSSVRPESFWGSTARSSRRSSPKPRVRSGWQPSSDRSATPSFRSPGDSARGSRTGPGADPTRWRTAIDRGWLRIRTGTARVARN